METLSKVGLIEEFGAAPAAGRETGPGSDAVRFADTEARKKLERRLIGGLEHPDPERFQLAAERMLELRLRDLMKLGDAVQIDTSYISHAEYQLFIDEKKSTTGEYHQPDHWSDTRFKKGTARAPVVGVRSSDATSFCQWLTARMSYRGEGGYRFRLPTPAEVIENPIRPTDDEDVPPQTSSVGTWTTNGSSSPAVGIPAEAGEDQRLTRYRAFRNPPELARQLASILEESFDRRLTSARAIVSDLSAAIELARALRLTSTRALSLARRLARSLDRAQMHDIDLHLDIDRIRAHALELARKLSIELDSWSPAGERDPVNEFDLAYELDRAYNNERTRQLARDLGRVYARERSLAALPDRSRPFDTYLTTARIRNRERARERACERERARDGVLTVISSLDRDSREYPRVLRLFLAFFLLQERIEGKLPAWEGIRIVRERVPRAPLSSPR